jgi:hypothetical protein
MVVTNTPEAMGNDRGEFVLHTKDGTITVNATKEEAAVAIWNTLLAGQQEKF